MRKRKRKINPKSLANLKRKKPAATAAAPETNPATTSHGTTGKSSDDLPTGGQIDVEDRAARFEEVAAGVPDAIGDEPTAAAGKSETSTAYGEALQPDEVLPGVQTVRFYLGTVFDQIAGTVKDPRWKLDPDELEEGAKAATPVVQKWLPKLLATSGYREEIAFCIVMFGIVGPRLMMPPKRITTAGTRTPESSESQDSANRT